MTHNPPNRMSARLAMGLLAAALCAGAAWAEKPEWAGRGNGHSQGDGPPGQMKRQQRGAAERYEADRRYDGDRRYDDDRRPQRHDRDRHAPITVQPGGYFNDGQRSNVHQWYSAQYHAGHCPPGLAKKNNGCLPPGQARKWRVGQQLSSGVVYYAVPQPVLVQIGLPPAGYRYVRVGNDILLLAVGSRMVVDAITDLGRAF